MQIGLEFAPGTTPHCKELVARMFKPDEILGAYRMARQQFRNGDIVLQVSEADPSGFQAEPRIAYLKRLRLALGSQAHAVMPTLGIASKSAHTIMQLPFESDAFWLVIIRGRELPSMCVLYSTPFEVTQAS